MKNSLSSLLLVLLASALALRGAESVDEALKRAALDYRQRLTAANAELTATREKIAREKAPLLKAQRAAEDRIIAAESANLQLETAAEQAAETRRKLGKDADALRKNENYLGTLARDSFTAFAEGLLPGERPLLPEKFTALNESFASPAKSGATQGTIETADLLLERVQLALGGYRVTGSSLLEGSSQLVPGTFAFAGPETFFRADAGGVAGTVRTREGSGQAVTYVLPEWKTEAAAAFFQGKLAEIPADASAGKALRLKETKGTLLQHINKGGVVSYAILCVGLASILLILQKLRDAAHLAVDRPETMQRCLETIARGNTAEAEKAVAGLKLPVRELYATGLRHLDESREILEERLTAVLLRQRLHYERWLPLLAVIATAAPLMGLLGTVTGMVRTFSLITVFGTGNAGKLASGISEVLVATELGLLVAIPTLVAHGFLSQRIQKRLSLLERYALEFVTAAQSGKPGESARESNVA